MKIIQNSLRQNEKDQTIFWTLTDDKAQSYQWWGDIPKGVDVRAHLDAHKGEYLLLIRNREYPDAPPSAKSSLVDMEEWIADGCVIPAVLNDEEEIIEPERTAEKKPWTQTYPPDLMDEAEEVSLKAKIANMLASMTYETIDSTVDSLFGNLTVGQRKFLKVQAAAVLWLLRKHGLK